MSFSRIVLVGSGHAHIQAVKAWAMSGLKAKSQLILVSDQTHAPYSGMLPGWMAGVIAREELEFDLWSLSQKLGFLFLHDRCERIDVGSQQVVLQAHGRLEYDRASINVGIKPKLSLQVAEDHQDKVLALKPISSLMPAWENLWNQWVGRRETLRLAVVGGGAAGCESAMACCLKARRLGLKLELSLFHSHENLLAQGQERAGKKMQECLQREGAQIRLSQPVTAFRQGQLWSGSSALGEFDFVIVATQAVAPDWFRTSGLPVDEQGFLRVDAKLRVEGLEDLFAAGDCVHFVPRDLPKAGVFVVRQGPVLIHNLFAPLKGSALRDYHPQGTALALLMSGENRALAVKGSWVSEGPSLWSLKNWIDRRFMRRFQLRDYQAVEMSRPEMKDSLDEAVNTCGGCGSKCSWDDLGQVLAELGDGPFAEVMSSAGDAAEFQMESGRIQTSCDAFRTFIPDPAIFAEVAVYHAVSDLVAMGATPRLINLAISLADNPAKVQINELRLIMHQVLKVLHSGGMKLGKGHTAEAKETSLAITVIGDQGPRHSGNNFARQGDRLILTKALGSGVMLQALMRGLISGREVDRLIECLRLNPMPCLPLLIESSVHAATDVTGFGLIGHLSGLLPQQLIARIQLSKIPVLGDLAGLYQRGARPKVLEGNRRSFASQIKGLAEEALVLFDPQTQGGFLVCVAAEAADGFVSRLRQMGFKEAVEIGEVVVATNATHKVELMQR